MTVPYKLRNRSEIGGKYGENMEQIWGSYVKYGIGKDRGVKVGYD